MRRSNKVILASLNPHKLKEFQDIFEKLDPEMELVSPQGLLRNAEKISNVEIYNTYLENASAKARLVNHGAHYPALADDSGLEVQVLEGKPGVHSFRFAKPQPGKYFSTREEQDQANVQKLLADMKSGSPRTARFVTTLTLVMEGICISAMGTLEGTIAESVRGKEGFGYDPVFIPAGMNKTLAEMSTQEKNSLSHRTRAAEALMTEIKKCGIVFAKP